MSGDPISEWHSSPKRIRSLTQFNVFLAGGALSAYAGAALFLISGSERTSGQFFLSVTLVLLGFAVLLIAVYRRQMARASFYEERERAAKEGVDEAIGELKDITDLPALIRINKRQTDQYEALTRHQATSSYRLSQGALAIGLALLAGGSVVAVLTPESASKAVVGALTAIGSIVAGYISNTYLRVYERTLVQLNYYFQQPLVTSQVLTAERLADKLKGAQRDEAQRQIIERVLLNMAPSNERRAPTAPPRVGSWGRLTHLFKRDPDLAAPSMGEEVDLGSNRAGSERVG